MREGRETVCWTQGVLGSSRGEACSLHAHPAHCGDLPDFRQRRGWEGLACGCHVHTGGQWQGPVLTRYPLTTHLTLGQFHSGPRLSHLSMGSHRGSSPGCSPSSNGLRFCSGSFWDWRRGLWGRGGEEVTDDLTKSRWAAPAPGAGSHSPTSSTPMPPHNLGAFMTPNLLPLGPQPRHLCGLESSVCPLPREDRVGVVPSEPHPPQLRATLNHKDPQFPSLNSEPRLPVGWSEALCAQAWLCSHCCCRQRPGEPPPPRWPLSLLGPGWRQVWAEGGPGLSRLIPTPGTQVPPEAQQPLPHEAEPSPARHPLPWELELEGKLVGRATQPPVLDTVKTETVSFGCKAGRGPGRRGSVQAGFTTHPPWAYHLMPPGWPEPPLSDILSPRQGGPSSTQRHLEELLPGCLSFLICNLGPQWLIQQDC